MLLSVLVLFGLRILFIYQLKNVASHLRGIRIFYELYAKAEELLETLGCEHEQRRLSCVKDVCLVLVALVADSK